MDIPPGDILVHCGDFSDRDDPEEMRDFLRWFKGQSHPSKILVPGNHDSTLETILTKDFHPLDPEISSEGLHILLGDQDSWRLYSESPTSPQRFHFTGSPWSWIRNSKYRAFSLTSEESLAERWSWILNSSRSAEPVDVLITHVPPAGILDSEKGISWGSSSLRALTEVYRPRLHLFGHVHACGGQTAQVGSTLYANVACCGPKYNLDHRPLVFNITCDRVEVVS
jgi:predicted phosphohydrolase